MLPDNIQILSLTDIGCHEDIPETAHTIEGNAILKKPITSPKITATIVLPTTADWKLIRCMVRPAFILPGMRANKKTTATTSINYWRSLKES
jgi:hypothetical protein